ncbi:hypothetical protein [Lentibacillus sediminis]|uniref:hypothetical protein n=1 Tax=Lentibacillus sediminis TaxID=1940529 RepID=UPI000C1BC4FF|nr:hypothetical protein [Lentibacillus sediminis]
MCYFYHPGWCMPYHIGPYWNTRQYPPVNPDLFYQSANETKRLMSDAGKVLDKLANSKEFDAELMNAAQVSDTEKVKELIDSVEIDSDVHIDFNPDNLRLEFRSQLEGTECCRLLLALRWR